MDLLKCVDGMRYVNKSHIVSLYIVDGYKDGKSTLDYQVIANMTFGNGNEILFRGSLSECHKYIKNI